MELSYTLDVHKGSPLKLPWLFKSAERKVLMEGARPTRAVHVYALCVPEIYNCQYYMMPVVSFAVRLSCINVESVALQEVSFSAGEVLGSGGAEGECIYLIAQGQVDVLRTAVSASLSDVTDADDDEPPCQYPLILQLL